MEIRTQIQEDPLERVKITTEVLVSEVKAGVKGMYEAFMQFYWYCQALVDMEYITINKAAKYKEGFLRLICIPEGVKPVATNNEHKRTVAG
jgi:hypothetical protein